MCDVILLNTDVKPNELHVRFFICVTIVEIAY